MCEDPRRTVARYAQGLYQLSRPDPTASWAGGAFALGAGLAYGRVGDAILWHNGLLALVGVVSAISFGAHGLNDAYDWLTGTDRESPGEGTGGSRVIPEGTFSVAETALVGTVGLTVTAAVGLHLYGVYGWPVLALTVLGVSAPLAYSLPPLALAYRPFPELLVVVPALTGVTIGAELVLAGSISWVGVLVGLVHAAISISWYVVSRLPDYEADRRVGKTTTVVLLGRASAPSLSAVYLLSGVALSVVGLVTVGWPFVLTPALGAFMLVGLVRLDPFDPGGASALRYRQMRASTVHAALLALALSIGGPGL